MTVAIGEKLPELTLTCVTEDGPQKRTTAELFGGKKAVLFGLPGAFTGTCSTRHIPGYVDNFDKFSEAGIELVAVVSVNDVFVLQAWQKNTGASKIVHIADWDASFAKAAGLDIDLGASTLGVRSKRFAMIVDDGVVSTLDIEQSPGDVTVSGAENMLSLLNKGAEDSEAA